jgi:hypothetical protein
VGGGLSIVERDIGGEAWTNKLFAIIIDEIGGWKDVEVGGGGGRDDGGGGGGRGDIDLIVIVLSCEHRFWTKRIKSSLSKSNELFKMFSYARWIFLYVLT